MRATKEAKTNKGITLIALVITIIVMLILVGVTISMAVNGGLFEYAGNAAKETNDALKAEQQLADGGIKVGNTLYNSIDEYLIASGNKVESEGKKVTISVRLSNGNTETFDFPEGLTFGEAINQGLVDTTRWSYNTGNSNTGAVLLDTIKVFVEYEEAPGLDQYLYEDDEPDADTDYFCKDE